MIPKTTTWSLDPHTEAKHRILHIYLQGWLPTITGGLARRVIFIDGFCGPGEYDGGEDGSPVIALRALMDHQYIDLASRKAEFIFVFLDEDSARVRHLRDEVLPRLGTLPASVKLHVDEGEFEPTVTEILDDLDSRQKSLAPTLAFIDPFGWKGIPMKLMHRLLDQPKTELLITFMVNSVNRWLKHPDQAIRRHLDALFGCPDWNRIAQDSDRRQDDLRELYERQLGMKARYVRGFRMWGENNLPVYDLIFCSNHIQGMKKIKAAMWRVDTIAGGSFRDRDVIKPTLFAVEPRFVETDFRPLDVALLEHFAGKTASIGEIEDFVVAETDYRETHVRKRLRLLEDQKKIECIPRAGQLRRGKTYPAGTEIKFP